MFTTQAGKLPQRMSNPSEQDQQGSSPLLNLQPQVRFHHGQRVVTWESNQSGHQLANGFSALGFRVSSDDSAYLLYLDDEADELLLRLYDLSAALRWRSPQRQLRLFDSQLANALEVSDD